MTYGILEYDRLKFLAKYGFNIHNNSNGKFIEIYCIRDDCCIIYHEWPQFGDFSIFITKTIDDFVNHNYLRVYGFNWLISNVLSKYKLMNNTKKATKLDLVEFYLQEQIRDHKDAFGISIK